MSYKGRGLVNKIFFTVFLFSLLYPYFLFADSYNYSWKSKGIGGGGAFYSASMSPHNEDEIYIATDMSAVFHSKDFGTSWKTVNFSQMMGGHDSHVRFTSDANILYAINRGDDSRLPVKSTDGGESFSSLSSDPTSNGAYSFFADPSSTSRLLLSNYNNLYFSNDGGVSWQNVYSGSALLVSGVFWDGINIYVGSSDGLIVSSNNGSSFALSSVGGIPVGEKIVSFAGAKQSGTIRFFAVTLGASDVYPGVTGSEFANFQSIYTLNVGDSNWTAKNNGISSNAAPFFVSMALNDIDVAYVAGGATDSSCAPIVYKTSDGGNSWTNVFVTNNNQNIYTGWFGYLGDSQWWYPEYALGFTVSPTNSDRVIITDLGSAHVTSDGGTSWHQAYVKPQYENPMASPTPKGQAYSGNGLEDTSAWWIDWATRDMINVCFTDIRGIISEDGGNTWKSGISTNMPHNTTYHMVKKTDSGDFYAATSTVHDLYQSTYLADSRIDGGDGHIIVSSDNGKTWQLYHDFDHPVVWLAITGDTMYASVVHSSQGGIYVNDTVSTNSGNWVKLSDPPRTEGHPYNIHVLNDGSLLATFSGRRNSSGSFTESSGVFYSSNNGSTWEDRSHTNMRRWTKDVVIDPHDSSQNTWYAAVFSHWGSMPNEVGGVYRTTNRGVNWTRISDSYRVESVAIHPKKQNVMYFTTETEGLWVTKNLRDQSPSFSNVSGYPFSHPVRLFFNPYKNEIWATSFGGGLRVYNEGSIIPALLLLELN